MATWEVAGDDAVLDWCGTPEADYDPDLREALFRFIGELAEDPEGRYTWMIDNPSDAPIVLVAMPPSTTTLVKFAVNEARQKLVIMKVDTITDI